MALAGVGEAGLAEQLAEQVVAGEVDVEAADVEDSSMLLFLILYRYS